MGAAVAAGLRGKLQLDKKRKLSDRLKFDPESLLTAIYRSGPEGGKEQVIETTSLPGPPASASFLLRWQPQAAMRLSQDNRDVVNSLYAL